MLSGSAIMAVLRSCCGVRCGWGWAMPGVDTAMNTLTVPIWAAGAASAVLVVALMAAFGKLGTAALGAAFFRVAVIVIAVGAGYLYLERSTVQNRLDARRSLD